jgi:RimJ/RimL family protein N-acetyltransferase
MTDVDSLHRLANDPDIAANLSDLPYPYPREAAEGLVQAMPPLAEQGQAFAFAIVPENLIGEDTLAGVIFLILETAHQRGELVYWLGNRTGATVTRRKRRGV